jgi:hypothetical protein
MIFGRQNIRNVADGIVSVVQNFPVIAAAIEIDRERVNVSRCIS